MKMRITAFLLLVCSPMLWAADNFGLRHEVVGVEQIAGGTRLTLKLTLINHSSHLYHSMHLQMEDVTLSSSSEVTAVDFHTLAAGGSKQHFLAVTSTLSPQQLQHTSLLLFHLQGQDESGNMVSHLLRSVEVQP